jgi:hypothetical protein
MSWQRTCDVGAVEYSPFALDLPLVLARQVRKVSNRFMLAVFLTDANDQVNPCFLTIR